MFSLWVEGSGEIMNLFESDSSGFIVSKFKKSMPDFIQLGETNDGSAFFHLNNGDVGISLKSSEL